MSSGNRSLAFAGLIVVAAFGVAGRPGLLSERAKPAAPVEAFGAAMPTPLPDERPARPTAAAGPAPALEAMRPIDRLRSEPADLLAPQLAEAEREPVQAVRRLVDGMSDAELRSTLAELTNLDDGDLDDVRDLHDYSLRLAAIAMNGVITELEPDDDDVPELVFAKNVDGLGEPMESADRFDGAPRDRIYATFPTDRHTGDRVLVKWFREGAPRSLLAELLGPDPRMLVFGRYRINHTDATSYVWLSRDRRWEPGRYRVELYDPSEPLRRLAMGRFTIASADAPAAPAAN